MNHFPEALRMLLTQGFALVAVICLAVISPVNAQTEKASVGPDEAPVFQEYRGVRIGMAAGEVRKKLGNPADKGEEQDFFIFNENETAQIVYDKSHKVTAISFDFLNGARDVPTPLIVFGAEIEAKPDGSMYKMVRYHKAGYWLSFNRTSGDSPLTTVTMQKLEP
ncbi:MAG TPA: hypothetical protein VMM84_19525 [Pyrinomonadaceae bacterium]|nr:hypothetical protein [Pyrinomonadaceae bacterium]